MKSGKHFELQYIPSGRWRRTKHQAAQLEAAGDETNAGGLNETRPHFVPITPEGEKVVNIDGLMGAIGIPRGIVTMEDGTEKTAYRFQEIDGRPEKVQQMLDDLDGQVERLNRCSCDMTD